MSNTNDTDLIQTSDYDSQLQTFESHLNIFLKHHNLPSENILVNVGERVVVFKNFDNTMAKIDIREKEQSIYLSKFTAAVASGLFDAALNYLWDETIIQIRKRIVQYDLEYFYDNAVTTDKRSQFKDESDLVKMNDYDLIKGSKEIGLISEMGFKHLEYINYMRNWASSAHPNQNELSGLQLVSWLETCIKEVISLPVGNVTVKIKQLLSSIKSKPLSDEEAHEIAVFFTDLTQGQVNNLASGLFGIYINHATESQTLQNINILLPLIWGRVDEDTRNSFGLKYANFVASNAQNEKTLSHQFLQLVNAESYIPEGIRSAKIEFAIENLLTAHKQFNNFYSEPSFARELQRIVGDTPKLPIQLNKRYVNTIVNVFLTNGKGEAISANNIYKGMLSKLDSVQANIAILSFNDIEISSKLQFTLCQSKFRELIDIIRPIVTSPAVKDLIKMIDEYKGNLSNLRSEKQVKSLVDSLKVLL